MPSRFQRFILPGLGFKAVVIGGGYATGRELAEFFLPSGPWGGIAAMALATVIWSAVCVATFLFARASGARDYLTFVRSLLGPGWVAFEAAYVLFVVLILAVFGAAAGAIGAATLGLPTLAGTLALMVAIALVTAYGTPSVERLFTYVSFLLYGVYALFLLLALTRFGGRIAQGFAAAAPMHGWVAGGITYASYNIVGAVVILPVLRHLTSTRDAVVAGIVAGPLAMLPAVMFFACMMAYYPQIGAATLPSDFLLQRLDLPAFRYLFQLMIFGALLESGTGAVHALNERIGNAWRRRRGLELQAPGRAGNRTGHARRLHAARRAFRAGDAHRPRLSAARGGLSAGLRAAAPDRRHRAADDRHGGAGGNGMTKIGIMAAAAAVCVMTAVAHAAPPQDFEQRVEAARKEVGVPGMAVAIVEDDRVTFAGGFGLRAVGGNERVDADTIFPTGSTGKAFTVAALGILVDEGKIGWDDRVIDHLPGFQMYDPWVTREITIRDLLVHRSGLGLGEGDLLFVPRTNLTRTESVRRLRYLKPAHQLQVRLRLRQRALYGGRAARRGGDG